jgi:hypothetical protein
MNSEDVNYECGDCGHKIGPGAVVCPNCGASFEEEQEFTNIQITSDPFEIAVIESILDQNNIEYSVSEDSLNTIYGRSAVRPSYLLVREEQADQVKQLIEEYRQENAKQEEVTPISGVKGWLLFLCTNLVIINIVFFISYFAFYLREYPVNLTRYPLLNTAFETDILITMVMLIYGVITGIKLWRISPGALEFAERYFNIFLAYTILSFLLVFLLFIFEDVPLNRSTQIFIGDLIRETMGTIVFILFWRHYLKKSERVKNTYPSEDYRSL